MGLVVAVVVEFAKVAEFAEFAEVAASVVAEVAVAIMGIEMRVLMVVAEEIVVVHTKD